MYRPRLYTLLFLFQTLNSLIVAISLLDPNNNSHQNINSTSAITDVLLDDVFKDISEKQKWNLETIRNSKFKLTKIKFGTSQRYEYRIRFGKLLLLFKFPDELNSWKKTNLNSTDDFHNFIKQISSTAVLDTVKVDGPFDLYVSDGHALSLQLPLNVTHIDLKRVFVGEGITVEIRQAKRLSIFQMFDRNLNSSARINNNVGFFSFWIPFCMPLVPIHVNGSASLFAYKSRNPDAPIDTRISSKGTIELLPEKCYRNNVYHDRVYLSHSLSSKIGRLGSLLKTFLGNKAGQNGFLGYLRTNVQAATVVRFKIELEINVGNNAIILRRASEDWRTRPVVERVWFDVVARVEGEKLRPLTVKKVRPFIAVDSVSWSNLMSNISFTKFPSILLPSEALTLDVKW